jgi:general stress protein 26
MLWIGAKKLDSADVDRVWSIIEEISICMVTTHSGGTMRSRPMHVFPDRDENCLWFVTDNRGEKGHEISEAADVCLSFANPTDNTYLCVTGRAEMISDAKKAEELWSLEAQVWWPGGPHDPNVRVLRVVPERAEYWDTRGSSMVVSLKLAVARMTGSEPSLGDNKKVILK